MRSAACSAQRPDRTGASHKFVRVLSRFLELSCYMSSAPPRPTRLTFEYSSATRRQQRKAEALEAARQESNAAKKRKQDLDATKRSVTVAAARACMKNPMGRACRNSKQKVATAAAPLTAAIAAFDAAEKERWGASEQQKHAERDLAAAAEASKEVGAPQG